MNQELEFNSMNQEDREVEIDLLDLFYYYRSKIILIIAAFVVGAVIAGCVTHFLIVPKYTATSTMYMVSSSSGSVVDLSDLNIGESLSQDYVELIKTRPILEETIDDLNLDYNYEELLGMLDLSVVANTRIIKIGVTSEDPVEAKNIANDIANKAEKQLPKLMDAPKPNIAEYDIVPQHKSSPSLTKNTMIGALLLMLLVMAVLTVTYLMDDTVKTAEDVEKYFGFMPLTVIPEGKIEGMAPEIGAQRVKRHRIGDWLRRRRKKL
ncbi:MAG: capsular polysaccharide biosynthesis protein [Eubacterium sp.]|nr:capsular polysaccharide biosynthesis protein [Eubacterium sp.]